MKFPVNVSAQKKCPICGKKGPGTCSPVTPRPEVATITFTVMSQVHGRSYPVFLGSHLMFGWDSGISKNPRSRASLGAAFTAAKKDGRDARVGQIQIEFCSVPCMRRYLNEAVDELESRINKVKPSVRAVKKQDKSVGAPVKKRAP